MTNSFGPWATAVSAGSKAHLSTFWKRRLAMLPIAHRSSTRLGSRAVLFLMFVAALVWVLPTLRGAAAQTQPEKPAAQPRQAQQTSSQRPAGVAPAASKKTEPAGQNDGQRPAKAGTRAADAPIPATHDAASITDAVAIVKPASDAVFPAYQAGVLTKITTAAGGKVKKGDLLAVVGDPEIPASWNITAPMDGEIVDFYLKEGEWAERGKTVVRLVRLNEVIVESYIDRNTYPPAMVSGHKVETVVPSGNEGELTFPGKIVYVSPLVETGGRYLVRALVENRQKDGFWLLAPGLTVRLRILSEKTQ